MNNISNKQKKSKTGEWSKHPRPFLKREGNKKLRKDALEVREIPPAPKSKKDRRFRSKRLCPFCLDDIYFQNKEKETKQHGTCGKCGAVKVGMLVCSHCKSNDLWRRNNEYKCKNCGTIKEEEKE